MNFGHIYKLIVKDCIISTNPNTPKNYAFKNQPFTLNTINSDSNLLSKHTLIKGIGLKKKYHFWASFKRVDNAEAKIPNKYFSLTNDFRTFVCRSPTSFDQKTCTVSSHWD
jgi:hypothetical protein